MYKRQESNLTAAKAETVRLNMQLDSTISREKVDDYAQNVLGMVKAENYQIEYIDLDVYKRQGHTGIFCCAVNF